MYPPRPAERLPPSPSVDNLRAVLEDAPKWRGKAVGGIDTDEDEEGNPSVAWADSYLEKLFPALVSVVREHGVGDAGWKTIRWEVYDKYAYCIGGITFLKDLCEERWCDKADGWLCGRITGIEWIEERKSRFAKDYLSLLPLTDHRGRPVVGA
ncbi:hypothetical protein EXIGLDRAFT_770476 [Exidia glandulosa HHB12029]|uniref:Uncharacterized protein n=1 Tax=Exidia glandulosa HHB12029 TaxID=1314781 RepID=A0A165GPA5_EXIGL|nr:hypothetical protein EXIGLDRAFT_770476 [Exidia glandulosa HHB12029]